MTRRLTLLVCCILLLANLSHGQGHSTRSGTGSQDAAWKAFFPNGRTLVAVTNMPAGEEAFEVRSATRQRIGWVFRTDRVSPVVHGYNRQSQNGVLVAVSPQKTIVGVKLQETHDTPDYIRRLTAPFFKQFAGHGVDAARDDLDTVTGATISSRAIIKDVFDSAQSLLSAVAAPEAAKSRNADR